MAPTKDAAWPGYVMVALTLVVVAVGAQVAFLGGVPRWLPAGWGGVGLWTLILIGLALFGRWLALASGAAPRDASMSGIAIVVVCVGAAVMGLV